MHLFGFTFSEAFGVALEEFPLASEAPPPFGLTNCLLSGEGIDLLWGRLNTNQPNS